MNDFDRLVEDTRTRIQSRYGIDPTGRYVRARTLRALVTDLPGVPAATRTWFLDEIERLVIRGADLVDSFELGIAVGWLSTDNQPEGFMDIRKALANLDRLPLVATPEGSIQ